MYICTSLKGTQEGITSETCLGSCYAFPREETRSQRAFRRFANFKQSQSAVHNTHEI